MTLSKPSAGAFSFGRFRLDTGQRVLLSGTKIVPLEPKVFETLLALVEAEGHLVSKEELLQRVWPDTYVEEGSLARNVSAIRRALGVATDAREYVETIPKRGYRFVAPIVALRGEAAFPAIAGVETHSVVSVSPASVGEATRVDRPVAVFRRLSMVAGIVAGLAVIAALAFIGTKPGESVDNPAPLERLTTDAGLTTMPALSPDGVLLAYASDRAGRGDLDIWIQQSASGTPLRLTDDPADDDSPVFSPDGKQIAFRSDRSVPGIYIMPALGGTPRLIAGDGRRPRFSPDGSRLAFWTGQWRGPASELYTEAYVVSLTGGRPIRLLPEFAVARDPVWSSDGHSLLVFARRSASGPVQELDWWWTSPDGGTFRPTHALNLPGLRQAAASAPATLELGLWTSEAAIFTFQGNLWSLAISSTGEVRGDPQRLTYGTGPYGDPTVGGQGHVAFSVTEPRRIVERASLGDLDAPPRRLYADARPGFERTTQTLDGRTIVLERIAPDRQREIVARDTETGSERVVLRVDSPTSRVNATVSPNGARIVYTMAPLGQFEGTGLVVDTGAGLPRQVCENCELFGFLSDNQRVVATADGRQVIRLLDTLSKQASDLVRPPHSQEVMVDRPHLSPNDRLLAFRVATGTKQKTYVTRLLPGHPSPQESWHEVDETTTTGRPLGWSSDSEILYLFLDIDGFRCVWGQRVHPESGALIGKPFPVRHYHTSLGWGLSTGFGNAVAGNTFLYEYSARVGNIWQMRVPFPRADAQ